MLRSGLLALVMLTLAAADPWTDPLSDMSHTRALQTLWALRTPLAEAPDDQRLLGIAIEAHVNLCVVGERAADSTLGPWLERARELVRRRVAARQGKACATLAEASPELWVTLMEGRTKAVVDALAAWPAEVDTPTALALRLMATRDWRLADGRDLGVRGRMAQWWAVFDTLAGDRHRQIRADIAGLEPAMPGYLCFRHGEGMQQAIIARRGLAGVATMLRCPDLDDATALAGARTLAKALGAEVPAGADRAAAQVRLERAVMGKEPAQAAAWAAAINLCRELLVKPATATGLASLADCAAWNRAHLSWSVRYAGFLTNDEQFLLAVEQAAPGDVGVRRALLGANGQRRQHIPGAVEALATADPQRDPSSTMIKAALLTAEADRGVTGGALCRIIDAQTAAHTFVGDLPALATALGSCDLAGRANALLQAAVEADPWSVDLQDALAACTGQHPAPVPHFSVWTTPAPPRTWTDGQVDCVQLPWPNLGEKVDFAVAWNGALRIREAGDYALAIESDDASHLQVGGWSVDDPGLHGMRRSGGVVHLAAGDHPLQAWFFQGFGGAGCRLLWKPPGSGDWTPIPAEALVHDGDQPGLAAQGWANCSIHQMVGSLPPALVRLARDCPWLKAARLGAERAWLGYDTTTARELLPIARSVSDDINLRRIEVCVEVEAVQPDPARIVTLIAQCPDYIHVVTPAWFSGDYGGIPFARWFRLYDRIEILGLAKEGLAAFHRGLPCPVETGYICSRLALVTGDFTAAVAFARNATEGSDTHGSNYGNARLILEAAILGRMVDGREPDWDALLEKIRKRITSDTLELGLAVVAGRIDDQSLTAQAAAFTDGDEAYYYRGLYRLSIGDHAGAQADFRMVEQKHPTWLESQTCHSLLAWYATTTPERLAALPKAKPIKANAHPTEVRTGNDF